MIPRSPQSLARADELLRQAVRDNLEAAVPLNTRRAYASAWRQVLHTLAEQRLPTALPLSEQAIAAYVHACSARKLAPNTVTVHLAAIRAVHRAHNLVAPTDSPLVQMARRGWTHRWVKNGNRVRRVEPLVPELLEQVFNVSTGQSALAETRDRAMLMVAFACALRRSEVVALNVSDVNDHGRAGMSVYLARSKTDQLGEGAWLGIPAERPPFCPAEALRAWLRAGPRSGPLFCHIHRNGKILAGRRLDGCIVARMIKARLRALNLDSVNPALYSGHSARSGFVTAALAAGRDVVQIADHTRHRRLDQVRVYNRGAATVGKRNVARGLLTVQKKGDET